MLRFGKKAAPVKNMDPDDALEMFRFHINVYFHNSDECSDDSCDYCEWDNDDTWQQIVYRGRSLDEWMRGGGRPPREWSRRGRWLRLLRRREEPSGQAHEPRTE